MTFSLAWYYAMVALFSSSAWGQEAPSGATFTRVAISLFAVLLLIFVLAWVARRFGQGRYLKPGLIQILGGVPLGPKSRVVLLQVEDTRLLLGVTPESITPLLTLPPKSSQSADFQGILNHSSSSENVQGHC